MLNYPAKKMQKKAKRVETNKIIYKIEIQSSNLQRTGAPQFRIWIRNDNDENNISLDVKAKKIDKNSSN